jgi:hypothetical protein
VNKKLLFIALIIILISGSKSFAQIGGDNVYEFLNLTSSARAAALGNNMIAVKDNDINTALNNPSLITPEMHNQLGLSFVDFYSDINYGFVSYGRTFKEIGSFVGSMQYINYGTFTEADATGQTYGDFTAGEYAMTIGWGRSLDSNFSIGANFKMIYSSMHSYNSMGMAVDVGGSYHNSEKNFTISLVARNIGMQLSAYDGGEREPLPFEIQLGLSKRLQHLPFRYYIMVNHMEKWDLTYDDPLEEELDPVTGEVKEDSGLSKFGDKFMRHIVVGGEINPVKSLSIRIGYNYQRRQELKIADNASTVGFSWGIGLRIKAFSINYSRSTYHLHGSPNYITLSTDLDKLFKRSKQIPKED